MAKPKIFISSTFYDLRQIRAELDLFIENLGYEPIRNEEGDIAYGKTEALEEYCYKEIKGIDILISIIGGRFGSQSASGKSSISQMELKTALKEGKQVYIFIDQNILGEYETYLLNKDSKVEIKYRYVNDIRIYKFIEEIKTLGLNNNIKGFELASDITRYLKEQFAGLFQRFLQEQTRIKEISLISNLEKTSQTLNKLVNYLSEDNKGQTEEINKILSINHPLVEILRDELDIPYNFYVEGRRDLNQLLIARGFNDYIPTPIDDTEKFLYWDKTTINKLIKIKIDSNIFDKEGKLKFYKKLDWPKNAIQIVKEEKVVSNDDDDLPF